MYSQTRLLPFGAALPARTPVFPDVDVGLVGAVARLFEADLLAGADFVRVAMSCPPGRLSDTSAAVQGADCARPHC